MFKIMCSRDSMLTFYISLLSCTPHYLGKRVIIDVAKASRYSEICMCFFKARRQMPHMKITAIVRCQMLLPIHSGYVESMEASRQ